MEGSFPNMSPGINISSTIDESQKYWLVVLFCRPVQGRVAEAVGTIYNKRSECKTFQEKRRACRDLCATKTAIWK